MHFLVADPEARNVTCRFVLRGVGGAIPCLPAGATVCRFNTTLAETGSYILEIFADSKQVCDALAGDDQSRLTNAEGGAARLGPGLGWAVRSRLAMPACPMCPSRLVECNCVDMQFQFDTFREFSDLILPSG